jgi:hypothetical protein
MAATTMKTGRTYGRTTAWLALRHSIMRVRLGFVGSAHFNEQCVSVQPYGGGEPRFVPLRALSKNKDRAEQRRRMPIPLMEYPEYPKCDCWMPATRAKA